MKKTITQILLSIIAIINIQVANASCLEPNDSINEKKHKTVEQMPTFPGGEEGFMKFLSNNINYPQKAMEQGIQGRVVTQFQVKKDGSIGEVKIINKLDPDLDKEAIRVVKLLPKFIPGTINGEPANVWYTMPITFKLQSLGKPKESKEESKVYSLEIDEEEVVTSVDYFPEFPGGNAALMKFLSNNISYPQEAMEQGIQGKVVVQFIVRKDGSIGTVKVVKSIHPLLDEEAMRLVKILPTFKPAYRDEKPVNTWYTLPITFKLQTSEEKPKRYNVLTEVDIIPKFIGGEENMDLFLKNFKPSEKMVIKTSKTIRMRDLSGQFSAHFLVKKDGTVGDVKIVKSIHHSVDEEYKRIIKMFMFEPGIKDGKPIDTWCAISIFRKR